MRVDEVDKRVDVLVDFQFRLSRCFAMLRDQIEKIRSYMDKVTVHKNMFFWEFKHEVLRASLRFFA